MEKTDGINRDGKLAFSVDEFCEQIGIGRSLFYTMVARNKIRTVSIGGRRLVPATEAHRLASEGCE